MKKCFLLKSLKDIPRKYLKNKRVLLRADFNVPVGNDGVIDNSEDWRIKAVMPTIKYLLKNNAKIILLAHLGRPHGKVQEDLRLDPIKIRLEKLLRKKIFKMPDCVGNDVKKTVSEMLPGGIIILENLRFYPGEEQNDNVFSRMLSELGDIFINDAFADCHRKHSSIVGITKYLPSYAGLLLEKEFWYMKNAIDPKHPAVAIIGGAKIETKLPVVNRLAKIYDNVLVGGKIANEIINKPARYPVGLNIILPDKKAVLIEKGFDIGLSSLKKFSILLRNAKTIIWNGPLGKFEEKKYSKGTRGMINAIKIARKRKARILIGGGETISAFQKFAPGLMKKKYKNFNVSTGGGAMLEFLTKKTLPGIEVLKK